MFSRAASRVFVLAALALGPVAGVTQDSGAPPFALGERFTYAVKVAKMGATGHGAMWIAGPEVVRGVETYVLHFDSQAGLGPFRASDKTTSWLDPQRMAAMRFSKVEHHLFASHTDDIEIYPTQRRWTAADGTCGDSPTDSPLDELSFIYFIRTLPLLDDSVYVVERHYDVQRNPTTIRVVAHEDIVTKAGTFATLKVEMRVKDPRHYQGEGTIVFNFSDDGRRIPVRIESTVPVYGKTVLTLESVTSAP
ncbi:MAG TPA: DUF3108 domain-containing protein [Gemmatimonadaceae bacterium]|nr:DUF3108 domain-containing protein [Gemmatimonadaceae bacterium]